MLKLENPTIEKEEKVSLHVFVNKSTREAVRREAARRKWTHRNLIQEILDVYFGNLETLNQYSEDDAE